MAHDETFIRATHDEAHDCLDDAIRALRLTGQAGKIEFVVDEHGAIVNAGWFPRGQNLYNAARRLPRRLVRVAKTTVTVVESDCR